MGKILGYKKEKQRLFCQGISGKQRQYKKNIRNVLDKWDEENVGTPDVQFVLTLKKGFSFAEDDHIMTKNFDTVQGASNGLKSVYSCQCERCLL